MGVRRVKVAFVGKGGSGKTTLSALFCRHLAARGARVVGIDADINQHLAAALGDDEVVPPPLGSNLPEIKEFLRGTNPRIPSAEVMVKTTPPGRGSRLLGLGPDDPFLARWSRDVGGVRLMATGPIAGSDLGVACYHSKSGAVELYLNHLVDGDDEYVVVDMTAGADAFASGLFTRFDVTFLVAEPTRKAITVHRQYAEHARAYGVRLAVVGNKVASPADVEFLAEHAGRDLVACLAQSAHVRALEQGRLDGAVPLEHVNVAGLDRIRRYVDDSPRDWETFTRQAHHFHLRNAHAWANAALGTDLAHQIDPDFVLGKVQPCP